MEVYLDVLFLLNFAVDFLLLTGTNRLSGYPPGTRRALLAALVGGIYAGACVLPGFAFLSNTLWRLVSLGIMSAIAFGISRGAMSRGVLFLLLSMALGGIAIGLGRRGFGTLILAALGLCVLCLVAFRGRTTQQRYVPVTISHGDKTLMLTALVDTGNTLRDPISGRPVVIADDAAATKLLNMTREQLARPMETITVSGIAGLRLIPYRAVGQTGGMMLGIRPDRIALNGREGEYIVAFAPQSLGHGKYQALAGGAV